MRGNIPFEPIIELPEFEREKMMFLNNEACKFKGINKLIPFTKTRKLPVSYIRKAVYLVYYNHRSKSSSFQKIGNFYNQDHSTVTVAIKSAKNLLMYNDFCEIVDHLECKYFEKFELMREGVFYNKFRITNELKRLAFLGF